MLAEHWDQIKLLAWNSVWAANIAALSPGRARLVRVVRIGHMLARELGEGQLTVRAASLVYTTLLSLVPVLAVSFAMLKTFGVHQDFAPVLRRMLEPLGVRGGELADQLIGFVENLRVGGLGAMGLAVLLFTVVSLVQKIEQAFNYAWRVNRPRALLERFSRYLTVVMVGPVLVFTALTIIGSITGDALSQGALQMPLIATMADLGSKLLPFVLVVAAFTFTYVYIPNASVKLRSALAGGLFAGLLWVVAGWLFAELVVTSSRYTALYRGFAILILFMMWLYIGWLILLSGASVSFYHQHPEYLGLLRHELRASSRINERMAIAACSAIAGRFVAGEPAPGAADLATWLRVPLALLEDLLGVLERAGVLARTGDEPPRYLPARDVDAIRVQEVVAVVRRAHESPQITGGWLPPEPASDEIMGAIEAGVAGALGDRTLRDLAREAAPGAGAESSRARVTAIKRDGATTP